jgi:hypothetical protein
MAIFEYFEITTPNSSDKLTSATTPGLLVPEK